MSKRSKNSKGREQRFEADRARVVAKRNRLAPGQTEIPSDDSFVVRQSPMDIKRRELSERGAQGVNTVRQTETRKLREPKGTSVKPI